MSKPLEEDLTSNVSLSDEQNTSRDESMEGGTESGEMTKGALGRGV